MTTRTKTKSPWSLSDAELAEWLKPLDGKVLIGDAELKQLGIDLHRTTRFQLIRDGKFPPPVKLGVETNARNRWRSADIRKYVLGLVKQARQAA